jgi:hypothetical protein
MVRLAPAVLLVAFAVLLIGGCASESALLVRGGRVLLDEHQITVDSAGQTVVLRYWEEKFYFLPDAVTGHGFLLQCPPDLLAVGSTIRGASDDVLLLGFVLRAPNLEIFGVEGSLEILAAEGDSVTARVNLRRGGFPEYLFENGVFSIDRTIAFSRAPEDYTSRWMLVSESARLR